MPVSKGLGGIVLPDLARKRVLITGAGSGIGAGIALGFAEVGAEIGLHYNRSHEAASALAEKIRAAGGKVHLLPADLSAPGEAANLVDAFVGAAGGLDVLINNAGGPELLAKLDELSDEDFDHIFDLNARAVMALCRASIPHLRRSGSGSSIINVTSLSARAGSGPGASIYGASKAFVAAMTKTLAKELAPEGIRVNALSPGLVQTAMHGRVSTPEMVKAWVAQIPMGRAGRPEDLAGPALFLASSALSGFVTGQSLEVNGGQMMLG